MVQIDHTDCVCFIYLNSKYKLIINYNMGITTTKADRLPFNINDYKQVEVEGNENFHVFRNLHTGIQMEEYILQFNDFSQFQQYEEGFNWRLNQDYIVNTIHFIHNNQKEFCSTTYGAFLYSQRIPLRLSDICDIPFPDNLHVLYSCFQGFGLLYPKTNYFDIHENFIGFNSQAITKVWINSDFSKNYPDTIGDINDKKDERDMVRNIIEIVNSNTDHSSEPSSLFDFFMQHDELTFAEAKLLLKQYAKQHKIKIPETFESIQQYLDGDNNQQQKLQSNKKLSSHLVVRKSDTQQLKNIKTIQNSNKNYRSSTNNKHLNKIYEDNNQLIIIHDKNSSDYYHNNKCDTHQDHNQRVNKTNHNYQQQQKQYLRNFYEEENIITFPSHRQEQGSQMVSLSPASMYLQKPKVIFNYMTPKNIQSNFSYNHNYSHPFLNVFNQSSQQLYPYHTGHVSRFNNLRPINQINLSHKIIMNNPYQQYSNLNLNYPSSLNYYQPQAQIPCEIIYQQPEQSYEETEQYHKQNHHIVMPHGYEEQKTYIQKNHQRTQLHSSEIVTKKKMNRLNQSSSQKDILNGYPNLKFPEYHDNSNEFHEVKIKKQKIINSAKEILQHRQYYNTHSPDTTIMNNNKSQNQIAHYLSQDYQELDPQIAADLMMMTL